MTLTEAELAGQPAAYWTRVAYEAVIAFTRAQQAERGFTQPQFWLLRHLSRDDLSPDGAGMTVPELESAMVSYLRPEDDLEAEGQALVERGWLRLCSDGRYWLTPDGEEARLTLKKFAPEIRAEIHAGISDADYVVALTVLRQLIRNTGGRLED